MSPAEMLRAAAAVLREQAAKATSPEWWTPETVIGPSHTWFDAEWIATVHPGLAEPLAAWLDSAAVDAEEIGLDFRALAVARVLLGEEAEEKP